MGILDLGRNETNWVQYGVLICIRCHDYRRQDLILGAALYFIIPCHLFLAYVVELVAAQQARRSLRGGKKRSGTATPGGSYVASDEEVLKFQSTWKLIAWVHGINV